MKDMAIAPHFCQDGHAPIRHWDSENEMCPLCRALNSFSDVTNERDELKRRFAAVMPLFEEARDALPAISTVAAKLHGVRLDLADRMDDVGIPERWAQRQAEEAK